MFRVKSLAALTALLILLVGCGKTDTQAGTVHHVVICWLKEPGNAQARQRLIDASRGFADLPGLLRVSAGECLPSQRPGVDSTFDVAIVFTFSDQDALASYLASPRHKQATAEVLQPLTQRVLIYDLRE